MMWRSFLLALSRASETLRIVLIVVGVLIGFLAVFLAIFLGYFGISALLLFVVLNIVLVLISWRARHNAREE